MDDDRGHEAASNEAIRINRVCNEKVKRLMVVETTINWHQNNVRNMYFKIFIILYKTGNIPNSIDSRNAHANRSDVPLSRPMTQV